MSNNNRATVGKRVSAHPLHETFLGKRQGENRDEFYGKVEHGSLVADLDVPDEPVGKRSRGTLLDEPVLRVQRVFTTPLDQLEAAWHAAASQYQSRSS